MLMDSAELNQNNSIPPSDIGQRFLELAIQKGNVHGKTLLIFSNIFCCRRHRFRHYQVNGIENDCLERVAQSAIIYLEFSLANFGLCPINNQAYRIQRKPRDGSFYTFLLSYQK